MKKVNAQLREAEDRRMKCDGAKTWVSNTMQEPGLSREGSLLRNTGQEVQPGRNVEGPLPGIWQCRQCDSWKDGLTNLLSRVFKDLSVPQPVPQSLDNTGVSRGQ